MKYKAMTGLTYPTNPSAPRDEWLYKEVRQGEVVDDIPKQSVPWLLEQGLIQEVSDERPPKPRRSKEAN